MYVQEPDALPADSAAGKRFFGERDFAGGSVLGGSFRIRLEE
jgi:hypothetical protein